MNESLVLALTWLAGLVLGGVFFGGLWWTVRRGVTSRRPALLFLGSMVLRTSIVIAGFYVVSDAHWQRLLACLLGFVIARFLVTRFAGPPLQHPLSGANSADKGASHAP